MPSRRGQSSPPSTYSQGTTSSPRRGSRYPSPNSLLIDLEEMSLEPMESVYQGPANEDPYNPAYNPRRQEQPQNELPDERDFRPRYETRYGPSYNQAYGRRPDPERDPRALPPHHRSDQPRPPAGSASSSRYWSNSRTDPSEGSRRRHLSPIITNGVSNNGGDLRSTDFDQPYWYNDQLDSVEEEQQRQDEEYRRQEERRHRDEEYWRREERRRRDHRR